MHQRAAEHSTPAKIREVVSVSTIACAPLILYLVELAIKIVALGTIRAISGSWLITSCQASWPSAVAVWRPRKAMLIGIPIMCSTRRWIPPSSSPGTLCCSCASLAVGGLQRLHLSSTSHRRPAHHVDAGGPQCVIAALHRDLDLDRRR